MVANRQWLRARKSCGAHAPHHDGRKKNYEDGKDNGDDDYTIGHRGTGSMDLVCDGFDQYTLRTGRLALTLNCSRKFFMKGFALVSSVHWRMRAIILTLTSYKAVI